MGEGFIPETELMETETPDTEAETSSTEVVETGTQASGSFISEGVSSGDVSFYSAYDGSFSSTYVEYFRGFASKLPPSCHYLCYRDGQYSYVFYFSAGLSKDGDIVSGTAGYYRLNVYDGYHLSSGVGDISEDVTQGMYYSDFDGCPSLLGGDYYVQVSLLFALCIFLVFGLLHVMYRLARHFRC